MYICSVLHDETFGFHELEFGNWFGHFGVAFFGENFCYKFNLHFPAIVAFLSLMLKDFHWKQELSQILSNLQKPYFGELNYVNET